MSRRRRDSSHQAASVGVPECSKNSERVIPIIVNKANKLQTGQIMPTIYLIAIVDLQAYHSLIITSNRTSRFLLQIRASYRRLLKRYSTEGFRQSAFFFLFSILSLSLFIYCSLIFSLFVWSLLFSSFLSIVCITVPLFLFVASRFSLPFFPSSVLLYHCFCL